MAGEAGTCGNSERPEKNPGTKEQKEDLPGGCNPPRVTTVPLSALSLNAVVFLLFRKLPCGYCVVSFFRKSRSCNCGFCVYWKHSRHVKIKCVEKLYIPCYNCYVRRERNFEVSLEIILERRGLLLMTMKNLDYIYLKLSNSKKISQTKVRTFQFA